MKKIKIIFGFTLFILTTNLFNYIKLLIFTISSDHSILPENSEYSSILFLPSWWISNLLFLVLSVSLVVICIGLWKIIKNGIFTIKENTYLKTGAYILLVVGLINLINDYFNSIPIEDLIKFFSITTDLIMIMTSVAILIFVDVLDKGTTLQKENDLTI